MSCEHLEIVSTTAVSLSGTAVRVAVGSGSHVRIAVATAAGDGVYCAFGDSTVVATTVNGFHVPGGVVDVVRRPPTATHLSVIDLAGAEATVSPMV
jgi:hypothetical protein